VRDPGPFCGQFPSASAAYSLFQQFPDFSHAFSIHWCEALVLTMACMCVCWGVAYQYELGACRIAGAEVLGCRQLWEASGIADRLRREQRCDARPRNT
jgi:hypothetical protein